MSNGLQRVVLVVDPDPGAAAALGPALRREGYQVRIARDGARALQLAVARLPDVILVDEATPVVAPRTLVRILRSNARTSAVPILYAGTDAQRLPEGANAFVQKPLDTDDVLASIRAHLGDGGIAPVRDDDRVEGSLAQLPLPDVLQMLGNNRRSGRLVVSTETMRAEIAFSEGEIVDAIANGVVGEKALFRALVLREGRFVFQPGPSAAARRIERPLTELLLRGLGLSDELAALAPQLPPRDTVVVAMGPVAVEGPAPAAPAGELRTLLASPQRLGDLLDRCSATDLDTARAVLGLLASGEVRLADAASQAVDVAQPFLAQADVQVLRTRLRHGPGLAIGKVLLAGGDAAARRGAIERLSRFAEFRASESSEAGFGTVGALGLQDVRLDVVLLPDDPVLFPLWGPLATGALGALVLGPTLPADKAVAALVRLAHAPIGWCGPPATPDRTLAAGEEGYLGSDPAEALRALVVRAVARSRSS